VSGLMGVLLCGKGVPPNGKKKTSSYKSNIKKPTK
jgi:hypothetical protein